MMIQKLGIIVFSIMIGQQAVIWVVFGACYTKFHIANTRKLVKIVKVSRVQGVPISMFDSNISKREFQL